MSQIDEFESAFKSAAKPVFSLAPLRIAKVLVILDSGEERAQDFLNRINAFVSILNTDTRKAEIRVLTGDQYGGVESFLQCIDEIDPDLICTYRNLQIPASEFPYSLGVYIDVLTQATSIPVLLFPRPELMNETSEYPSGSARVVAVTDHLAGDRFLVSYAAAFTEPRGTLTLMHVEDEQTFDRYIATIAKIPDLDTDTARETIMNQLLKEPEDYVESCRQGIADAGLDIVVDSVVTVGHHLSDYRALLHDRQIDLLVMNTKDDDQLAMHGLAYPLSVEIRDTPLLLI